MVLSFHHNMLCYKIWYVSSLYLPKTLFIELQICMTCRLRCFCCSETTKSGKSVKSATSGRFSLLGRNKSPEPEITRLDLLPPNFVESHFGKLIKTSVPNSMPPSLCRHGDHVGEVASVRRPVRNREPKIDPTKKPNHGSEEETNIGTLCSSGIESIKLYDVPVYLGFVILTL